MGQKSLMGKACWSKASVVVRTYNEPPELFKKCISLILGQKECTFEIIVVDSSTTSKIKDICQAHGLIKYNFISSSGLSEGRNKGIGVSKYDYVAFTDPDCFVDPFWLKNLCNALDQDSSAVVAGGKIVPNWLAKPPIILKGSRLAWAALSLLDLGDNVIEVEKIVGGNFAINKRILAREGYFSRSLGRRKGSLISGEETDLCSRARKQGLKVIYTPFAIVEHQIPPSRLTFRWMFKRMYYGGFSRATRGGTPETDIPKRDFNDYIFLVVFILPYLAGFAWGKLHRKT